jgi:sulfate adenylyltransferase subunit 1
MNITIDNVHEYLAQHEQKELLRFVAVGSVDDGKSTLIGRLLYDAQGIYEDQLAAVESASKRRGSAGDKIDLALLTDGLRAEREQGITIDVAYRYFSTDHRKFIIADTPGHVQYTRNMATGASTADVALTLIDARHGVLQQSRRHAYIASLLGIPYLAVCVNKMDLVDYDQSIFDAIVADFEAFAEGLGFAEVRFLPVCAVTGDNVVHASKHTPWNQEGTVLGFLESVPIAGDRHLEAFRYPVQYVLRPNLDYRGFCGQIASGMIRKGDDVVVMPSGRTSKVMAIDTYSGELDEAYAPMSVTLRLEDELDVSRGDMIVRPEQQPMAGRRLAADLVWMSEAPLDPTKAYLLKHTTRLVRVVFDRIVGVTNLETLVVEPANRLELNDIGQVEMSSNQELHFDAYEDNRAMGAFVLIDAISNDTVAAGMIRGARDETRQAQDRGGISLVTDGERRRRFGHQGALIAFDGEPCAWHVPRACALERDLFDRGLTTTVVDVAAIADGTRSPALLADIAEQCVRAGLVTIMSAGLPRAADREQLRARFTHAIWLAADLGEDDENEMLSAVGAALSDRGIVDPVDD